MYTGQEKKMNIKNGQLSIHSENILPIIKKWLYSDRDIFIRELAANAADALSKLAILQARQEGTNSQEPKITISSNAKEKTITVSDTGVGLTAEEADKFLSQIAFSGAEEFIKTYQLNDTFIGHFGLGFFSAFMVADKVEVISKSYKPEEPSIIWHSDGSSAYSIQPFEKNQVGTDVILYINAEHVEYLDNAYLKKTLRRYCSFFPYKVYLEDTLINHVEPLWLKKPSECTEKEYTDFYKQLYPFDEPPLFWVHLNVDYPFHVQGILYFPKAFKEIGPNESHIQLFSNRVFVTDNCKDILPDYLSLLKGVLDSPDIPLNVSRSHLQVDKTVRQLANHIAKKVADALQNLFKNDRKKYESCWESLDFVVKLGMIQDDKFFERGRELLLWKTINGSYKTLNELALSQDHKKVITYCELGQEKSPLATLYESKQVPVAISTALIDHPLMAKIERNDHELFRRIDATIHPSLIDFDREKTILDPSGRSEAAHIADFFRTALPDPSFVLEAKSLALDSLPAILTLSEEERRFRDYMQRTSGHTQSLRPKTSLTINTNNPLVIAAMKVHPHCAKLGEDLAKYIYQVTRLSHKEMLPEELHPFTEMSIKLIEELAEKISKEET
jgi:molecular chaperone HtpG